MWCLILGLLPLNFGEYVHPKGIRILTSHTHSIGCAMPEYIADNYFPKVRSSACVCVCVYVRARALPTLRRVAPSFRLSFNMYPPSTSSKSRWMLSFCLRLGLYKRSKSLQSFLLTTHATFLSPLSLSLVTLILFGMEYILWSYSLQAYNCIKPPVTFNPLDPNIPLSTLFFRKTLHVGLYVLTLNWLTSFHIRAKQQLNLQLCLF